MALDGGIGQKKIISEKMADKFNKNDVLECGNVLASRQYYNQTITLIEYNDKFYEKSVFNLDGLESPAKVVPCTDKNFDLYIILEARKRE